MSLLSYSLPAKEDVWWTEKGTIVKEEKEEEAVTVKKEVKGEAVTVKEEDYDFGVEEEDKEINVTLEEEEAEKKTGDLINSNTTANFKEFDGKTRCHQLELQLAFCILTTDFSRSLSPATGSCELQSRSVCYNLVSEGEGLANMLSSCKLAKK
ncbi:uncharacterized protein LOC115182236 isoform X3 [Salmo trutta]|uniref:uncharacterized protein LOC115182236 isoform X3 n=1 Tax=Salmo trutta TaxID=8032 RepID=UPI00113217F2|nr:uncharacterized protein LOC115182236 isoform X3 [Salmo trutta]